MNPLVALTVNQVVGVTLSKLRPWAGQCAFALRVQGCCSSQRGVRHEPGPEVAVHSNMAFGAEATVRDPLTCKASRVP